MVFRLVQKSLVKGWKKAVWVVLSVAMGTALAGALIGVLQQSEEKLGRELREYGANIVVVPQPKGGEVEIGGVNYTPFSPEELIQEKELYRIKKIFWRHQIVGFAPFLTQPVLLDQGDGTPVVLRGTWFQRALEIPGEDFSPFAVGLRGISPWWKVEGRWINDSEERDRAMVGSSLARRHGITVGERISVSKDDQHKELEVVGIVTTGGPEDHQIFTSLEIVQDLSALPGRVQKIWVSALVTPEDEFARKDLSSMSEKEHERWYCTPYVSSIAFQIEETLPGTRARPIRQIAEGETRFLSRMELLIVLIACLAVATGSIGVMTAMTRA